jgi:predicted Zn-dependent protease
MYQALAGVQLVMAGRLDDGIARIRTTLQKAPGFGFGYMPLSSALAQQGKSDEALSAMKEHYARVQGHAAVVEALESGRAAGGYPEALRRAAAALEELSRSRHVPPSTWRSSTTRRGTRRRPSPGSSGATSSGTRTWPTWE